MQIHKSFFVRARFNNEKLLNDFRELEKKFKDQLNPEVEKWSKLEQELHVLIGSYALNNKVESPINKDADFIINFER